MKTFSPPSKVPLPVKLLTVGGVIAIIVAVVLRISRSRELGFNETGELVGGALLGILLALFVYKEVERQLMTCVSEEGISVSEWAVHGDAFFLSRRRRCFPWSDVTMLNRDGFTLRFTVNSTEKTLNLIFYKNQEEVFKFAHQQWQRFQP